MKSSQEVSYGNAIGRKRAADTVQGPSQTKQHPAADQGQQRCQPIDESEQQV